MSHENRQNDDAAFDRLVIVSNRLPITVNRDEDSGKWQFSKSVGGLVTALTAVLKDRNGLWIGWPGVTEEADLTGLLNHAGRELGCTLKTISLTKEEIDS